MDSNIRSIIWARSAHSAPPDSRRRTDFSTGRGKLVDCRTGGRLPGTPPGSAEEKKTGTQRSGSGLERRSRVVRALGLLKKVGAKRTLLRLGGGGWIRTTEAKRNRFTVCPLWPLGNSSIWNCGAGGRIRTPDLLITNQLLYRLSYTSTWRLSNSKRYYIKEQEACQVKHQKFFSIPLRDSQREPARWLCARCGQEQYSWDGVGVRRGRRLCARCLSRNRIQEEWI